MTTVFVTGANRGLGLEFCRQYAEDGAHVIATSRTPEGCAALKDIGAECHLLDVTNAEAAQQLAHTLSDQPIDILINNAGIMGDDTKTALNADLVEWQTAFQINVLGPVIITRALLANLKLADAPVAVTIGSQAGIFDKIKGPNRAVYNSTKAAAHAATISLGRALEDDGVLYFSLRPGYTKTGMTGNQGDYTAIDSVQLMRQQIAAAQPEWAGLFIDRSGKIFPYSGGFSG